MGALTKGTTGTGGGEGSRGGHVIGHTSGGKPIYQASTEAEMREHNKHLSVGEHWDASRAALKRGDPMQYALHMDEVDRKTKEDREKQKVGEEAQKKRHDYVGHLVEDLGIHHGWDDLEEAKGVSRAYHEAGAAMRRGDYDAAKKHHAKMRDAVHGILGMVTPGHEEVREKIQKLADHLGHLSGGQGAHPTGGRPAGQYDIEPEERADLAKQESRDAGKASQHAERVESGYSGPAGQAPEGHHKAAADAHHAAMQAHQFAAMEYPHGSSENQHHLNQATAHFIRGKTADLHAAGKHDEAEAFRGKAMSYDEESEERASDHARQSSASAREASSYGSTPAKASAAHAEAARAHKAAAGHYPEGSPLQRHHMGQASFHEEEAARHGRTEKSEGTMSGLKGWLKKAEGNIPYASDTSEGDVPLDLPTGDPPTEDLDVGEGANGKQLDEGTAPVPGGNDVESTVGGGTTAAGKQPAGGNTLPRTGPGKENTVGDTVNKASTTVYAGGPCESCEHKRGSSLTGSGPEKDNSLPRTGPGKENDVEATVGPGLGTAKAQPGNSQSLPRTGPGKETTVESTTGSVDDGGTDALGENDPQQVQELETGGEKTPELRTKTVDDLASEVVERMDVLSNVGGLGKSLTRTDVVMEREYARARAVQVAKLLKAQVPPPDPKDQDDQDGEKQAGPPEKGAPPPGKQAGPPAPPAKAPPPAPPPQVYKASRTPTDDLVESCMKGEAKDVEPVPALGAGNQLTRKVTCKSCKRQVPEMFKSGVCPSCGSEMQKSLADLGQPAMTLGRLKPHPVRDVFAGGGIKLEE